MRQLTEQIAAELGMASSDVEAVLQSALDAITEELVRHGRAKVGDFGAFEVKLRKARRGRNPRTGEKIDIPASVYASFKPGRGLKDRLGHLSEVPDAE